MHTICVLVMLCVTSMLQTTNATSSSLVCEDKQTVITGGYRSTTHDNGVTCMASGGTAGGWCMKNTMTQRGPSEAASLYTTHP
jgi:hypothetical protein